MSAVVLEASSVLHAHPQASRGRSSAGANQPTDPFSQLLEGMDSASDSTAPAQTAPERTRSEHSPRDDKAGARRTDAPAKVTKSKSANETKEVEETDKVDEAPAASDNQAPAEIASGTIELQTEIIVNIVLNGADIAAGEVEGDPVLPLDEVPAAAVDPATLLASAQLAPVAAPLPVTAAPSLESTTPVGDVAAVENLVTEMTPAASIEPDAPAPDALPSVAAKPVKSTSAGETADATQTPALFEESAAEPKLGTAAVEADVTATGARHSIDPRGAAQTSQASTAPHRSAEPQAAGVADQATAKPAELPAAGQDMSVARAAPEPLSASNPAPVPQSLTGSAMAPPAQPPAVTSAPAVAVPVAGLAIAIAARAQPGKNHFEIRLDPPELGRIDVRLDVDREGNVTSRLVVERAETLDLLRRDAPNLERAFQQAGLKTSDSSLQFSLRDQAFSGRDSGEQTLASARIIVPEDGGVSFDMQRNYGRLAGLGNGVDIRV